MDFTVLLNDLRDVAEKYQGKTSEPQVSTHAYVDMFTKILKRAQKVTEEYEDQITVLYVALNQLGSIYKDLSAGSARDQLCKFIFGMCAKTVLNIQWAQLDEDNRVKNHFCTTIEDTHKLLSTLGFHKFQLILDLMESHWTHPVLSKIMSGEEEDTEDCLEYIQKEDPDILKLRIEIMMKENCEEFALNLCTWSLKHPQLLNDLKIKEHQIFMLYKQQEYGKMQEVCETIVCHDGIKVMSHLAKTPSNQELCIRLAQVFLIQDWMRPERTCCTQELLKLWIHHQYLADKDEERFLDSIWTVAKVCRDTEQIGVLIDGVRKECGDMFIQLYSELCKYAINIDKGNMERDEVQQDKVEYNKRRLAMSKTCVRMAFMLKEYDFRMSRICGLTAFSLDPTTDNLNLVNKLYWTIKNVSAASQNSKINIATLYEIERLLGQMRPEVLNPDYSWKQLIPVCKKYKLDYQNVKDGIPMKKELDSESVPSQSSSLDFTETPMPDMLSVVKSDSHNTKNIDTGQKKSRKPKQHEIPRDIQKTHLAKLLKQKNLSNAEIEKVLSKEFPRNVSQDLGDAPSLDVKELDKTINDLKKSIDLETRYRELLKQNISSLQQSRKRTDSSVKSTSNVQSQHVSRHEQFRQQQQQQAPQNKDPTIHRQHSAPGGVGAQGPILHRQLSMGSPQPPHAHSHHRQQQVSPVAAFGGSPPPAHSTSPRMSSPTGFQSPLSPVGFRPHSASPTILNSRKSGAFSQMHTSHNRSETVTQLCNKIQGELQQPSKHSKQKKSSHINILRPPGNSKQECAKIAQQIAEMHERQRAERERTERLETARIQGQLDGMKAALNSRNIPSRSQISDLLSLTFQGNKAQKMSEGQKNTNSNLPNTETSKNKSYLKKRLERSESVSSVVSPQQVQRSSSSVQSADVASIQTPSHNSPNQSSLKSPSLNRSHSTGSVQGVKHVTSTTESPSNILVPGEQGWDASRGIMKQKYYYKTTTPQGSIGKGDTGDSSLTVKPVYSMIVPKELTNPNRKEDLVKTVTNMMKQFPKGMQQQQKPVISSQSTVATPPVVRVQSNQEQNTGIAQQFQSNTSPNQGLASSIMQNNTPSLDNQSNFLSGLTVSSQSLVQNLVEDGLLNLNTLATASVSVLGQTSNQQQLVGSVQQLTQPVQPQQMFASTVIESQPMYAPVSVQSVQQVVQQQEAILATPLYTMPAPVIAEPVLSQQLPGIQQHVDLSLQQPVVQQVITDPNQPLALNSTPQFVNVVSQQPTFQVSTGEHVTHFSGVTHSLSGEITPLMSTGITQHLSGGISNSLMDGMSLSMTSGITQPVSCEMSRPMTNMPTGTLSSTSVRPLTQKQFITAPELSPALVQQILTSLKKGGARSKQSKPEVARQSNSEGLKQTPVFSRAQCNSNETLKDSVKAMLAKRNDPAMKQGVNEARQKILELRKQFGQTAGPHANLPDLASVSPSQVAPNSFNNAVASPRKPRLLERLMSDEQDLNKIKVDMPPFLSPEQPNESLTSLSTSTAAQQVVPDLPDLGAKEFQIDSILALDNENVNTTENALPSDQFIQQNEASSVTAKSNETVGVVPQKEARLNNESTVQNRFQIETSIDGTAVNTGNLQNALQNDTRQEVSSSTQSTYYNANRLGKERQNREVKERENRDSCMKEQEKRDVNVWENRDVKEQENGNVKIQQTTSKPTSNFQQGQKAVCLNCDLFFPTEQHLNDHKQISNCESKWQCTYCKMTFKCSDILKSHEKNYCLKAPSAMVKCYNCGVYFQSHEQLKGHLNPKTCTTRTVMNETQSVEDIVCGICERKFESMNSLKEHVKIGCIKKDSSFSKESILQDYDFSVVFKCTKCNFMNFSETIVSKHVEKCKEKNITADLTKLYQCNMCEESICDKEDACRHVTRQCPKLRVTNTQRQVQDVYQRLKGSSTSRTKPVDSEKMIDSKDLIDTKMELEFSEEKQKRKHKETALLQTACTTDKIEQTTAVSKLDEKYSVANNVQHAEKVGENSVSKVSGEKAKGSTKMTANLKGKPKESVSKPAKKCSERDIKPVMPAQKDLRDCGLVKNEFTVSEDKTEITAKLQKEQRISAENRFFAEFNEMERRKQAIRMKKQKELEKLERKKKFERERMDMLREHQSNFGKEKIRMPHEKQDREKLKFESERKKHMDSILGNVTLEQKMKECIEKQKKSEKSQSGNTKEGKIKVLSVLKMDRDELKSQTSDNKSRIRLERKPEISSQSSQHCFDIVKNKKRKQDHDKDCIDEIIPNEKRALKEHSERDKIRTRRNDILKREKSNVTYGIITQKQRSPQDIRKMKGLRAKRLIKKQKFFIENFEMGPLFRKETEQIKKNTKYLENYTHESHGTIGPKIKNQTMDEKEHQVQAQVKEEIEQVETNQNQKRKIQETSIGEDCRNVCRFCGLESNKKPTRKHYILSHYIQSHKLGFRLYNYRYSCNFCNEKFPSSQTLQLKDHIFQNHREAVLKRVAAGRYDHKVEQIVKKTKYSPVKAKVTVQTRHSKHLRALALREKCAEKLRIIALTRENAIIDYSEYDEDNSIQTGSNNSTDTESREERIADVSAKIASLSEEKKETDSSSGTGSRDGRRIAPRLARQMVKDKILKGSRYTPKENELKTSEKEDSSDTQMLTRSRSSSISSSRSSLIASAKKRKAAIAISSRSSSKSRQSKFSRTDKLLLRRSGRAIRRPEIEYDKLTESSGLGSGEDNSELEDSEIRRRKSTRVRRLSERGKSFRDSTSETDESSTEEVKPRVTRHSLLKEPRKNDRIESDSQNTDQENIESSKRIRIDRSPGSRLKRETVEARSLKQTSQNKEGFVTVEKMITRQNSKNVEESDSETESNYTDIEYAVELLGLKMEKTADRSAESDSESTSVDGVNMERKYRLRKRSTNKKYLELESSDEERPRHKSKQKHKDDDDSDFEPSEENDNTLEDYPMIEKSKRMKGDALMTQVSDNLRAEESKNEHSNNDMYSKGHKEENLNMIEKPKVVLIGAEEDDDLNVDYGIDRQISEGSPTPESDKSISGLQTDNSISLTGKDDESSIKQKCTESEPKPMTVLVGPEDEFAGLESLPVKCYQSEIKIVHDSEALNEIPVESTPSDGLPATVMDEDEFEFLKHGKMSKDIDFEQTEEAPSSSFSASNKTAYDSEFVKYTETEKNEEDSESEYENDFSDLVNEKQMSERTNSHLETNSITDNVDLEIPPLPEDVPVLTPRDVADSRMSLKDACYGRKMMKERKLSQDVPKGKIKPLLKSARVVIEDISVVRKALEEENVEKKLREECEASSCSVRIGRLSKEEIEKHSTVLKDNVEEKHELEIILIEDSDEERSSLINVSKPEERHLNQRRESECNEQKQERDSKKDTHAIKNQYETLIQDIVLDGSIIDQLLVGENVTMAETNVKEPFEAENINSSDSSGCVQIVVENGNNLPGSVKAVDAQCVTSTEEDPDTIVESNNVIILVNGTEDDDYLNKAQSGNDRGSRKEIEEDIWVENAESYAETHRKSESNEKILYKNEVVPSDIINKETEKDRNDTRKPTGNVLGAVNDIKKFVAKEMSPEASATQKDGNVIKPSVQYDDDKESSEINQIAKSLIQDETHVHEVTLKNETLTQGSIIASSFDEEEKEENTTDLVTDTLKTSEKKGIDEKCEKVEETFQIDTVALNPKESSSYEDDVTFHSNATLDDGLEIKCFQIGDDNENSQVNVTVVNKKVAFEYENNSITECDKKMDMLGPILENNQLLQGNEDFTKNSHLQDDGQIVEPERMGIDDNNLKESTSKIAYVNESLDPSDSVQTDIRVAEDNVIDKSNHSSKEHEEVVSDTSSGKNFVDSDEFAKMSKETPFPDSEIDSSCEQLNQIQNIDKGKTTEEYTYETKLPNKNYSSLKIESEETIGSATNEPKEIHAASDLTDINNLKKQKADNISIAKKNSASPIVSERVESYIECDEIGNFTERLTEKESVQNNVEYDISDKSRPTFAGSSEKIETTEGDTNKATAEVICDSEEKDFVKDITTLCTSSPNKKVVDEVVVVRKIENDTDTDEPLVSGTEADVSSVLLDINEVPSSNMNDVVGKEQPASKGSDEMQSMNINFDIPSESGLEIADSPEITHTSGTETNHSEMTVRSDTSESGQNSIVESKTLMDAVISSGQKSEDELKSKSDTNTDQIISDETSHNVSNISSTISCTYAVSVNEQNEVTNTVSFHAKLHDLKKTAYSSNVEDGFSNASSIQTPEVYEEITLENTSSLIQKKTVEEIEGNAMDTEFIVDHTENYSETVKEKEMSITKGDIISNIYRDSNLVDESSQSAVKVTAEPTIESMKTHTVNLASERCVDADFSLNIVRKELSTDSDTAKCENEGKAYVSALKVLHQETDDTVTTAAKFIETEKDADLQTAVERKEDAEASENKDSVLNADNTDILDDLETFEEKTLAEVVDEKCEISRKNKYQTLNSSNAAPHSSLLAIQFYSDSDSDIETVDVSSNKTTCKPEESSSIEVSQSDGLQKLDVFEANMEHDEEIEQEVTDTYMNVADLDSKCTVSSSDNIEKCEEEHERESVNNNQAMVDNENEINEATCTKTEIWQTSSVDTCSVEVCCKIEADINLQNAGQTECDEKNTDNVSKIHTDTNKTMSVGNLVHEHDHSMEIQEKNVLQENDTENGELDVEEKHLISSTELSEYCPSDSDEKEETCTFSHSLVQYENTPKKYSANCLTKGQDDIFRETDPDKTLTNTENLADKTYSEDLLRNMNEVDLYKIQDEQQMQCEHKRISHENLLMDEKIEEETYGSNLHDNSSNDSVKDVHLELPVKDVDVAVMTQFENLSGTSCIQKESEKIDDDVVVQNNEQIVHEEKNSGNICNLHTDTDETIQERNSAHEESYKELEEQIALQENYNENSQPVIEEKPASDTTELLEKFPLDSNEREQSFACSHSSLQYENIPQKVSDLITLKEQDAVISYMGPDIEDPESKAYTENLQIKSHEADLDQTQEEHQIQCKDISMHDETHSTEEKVDEERNLGSTLCDEKSTNSGQDIDFEPCSDDMRVAAVIQSEISPGFSFIQREAEKIEDDMDLRNAELIGYGEKNTDDIPENLSNTYETIPVVDKVSKQDQHVELTEERTLLHNGNEKRVLEIDEKHTVDTVELFENILINSGEREQNDSSNISPLQYEGVSWEVSASDNAKEKTVGSEDTDKSSTSTEDPASKTYTDNLQRKIHDTDLDQIQEEQQMQYKNLNLCDENHTVEKNNAEEGNFSTSIFDKNLSNSVQDLHFELPSEDMPEAIQTQLGILSGSLQNQRENDTAKAKSDFNKEVFELEEKESDLNTEKKKVIENTCSVAEIQNDVEISDDKMEVKEDSEKTKLICVRQESVSSSSDISLISFPEYFTEQLQAGSDTGGYTGETSVANMSIKGASSVENDLAKSSRNDETSQYESDLNKFASEEIDTDKESHDSGEMSGLVEISSCVSNCNEKVSMENFGVDAIPEVNKAIYLEDVKDTRVNSEISPRNEDAESKEVSGINSSTDACKQVSETYGYEIDEISNNENKMLDETLKLDRKEDINVSDTVESDGRTSMQSRVNAVEIDVGQAEALLNKKDLKSITESQSISGDMDVTETKQREQHTSSNENISLGHEDSDNTDTVIDTDKNKTNVREHVENVPSDLIGSSVEDTDKDSKQKVLAENVADVPHSNETTVKLVSVISRDTCDTNSMKLEVLNVNVTGKESENHKSDSYLKITSKGMGLNVSNESVESCKKDSSLDQLVKENEERRKVFDQPSPRRKGMIVGSACLHKKPTNHFVESVKKVVKGEVRTGNEIQNKKNSTVIEEHQKNKSLGFSEERGSSKHDKKGKDHFQAFRPKIRTGPNSGSIGESNNIKIGKEKFTENDNIQSSETKRKPALRAVSKRDSGSNTTSNDRQQNIAGSHNNTNENTCLDMITKKTHFVRNDKISQKKMQHSLNENAEKFDQNGSSKKNVKCLDRKIKTGKDTTSGSVQESGIENTRKHDQMSGDEKVILLSQVKRSAEFTHDTIGVSKKSAHSFQHSAKQKPGTATGKRTEGKDCKVEKVVEQVQLENETDEEFKRRTETVRCARRRSAVKPYESDFNFEESENNKNTKIKKDTNVMSSTSFWPSESESKMENIDTASFYSNSSSSSSSTNTNAIKEGKSKVVARCARDFGKEEVMKQKVIQLPQTSAIPVFTCSSPEKATVSAMAVKLVKTMGAGVQNAGQNQAGPNIVKYTIPALKGPIMSSKIKMLDKNVLSNTSLPARIVKVATLKSIPNISKTFTLSSTNIDETLRNLTRQGKLGKETTKMKVLPISVVEKEKSVKGKEVKKAKCTTELTLQEHTGTSANEEDFEPSAETLSNKAKALRALHKSNKPFKWENSPSPPKKLRSQTRENKTNTVTEKDKDNTVAERDKDKTVAESDKVKTVTDRDKDKTVADRDKAKTLAERGKVKTVADRDKDKTLAEKDKDKTLAERGKVKTVADRDKDKNLVEKDKDKTLTERGKVKTVADRDKDKTLAERGRAKTFAERDKDKMVAEKDKYKTVAERDKVKTVAGKNKDKTQAERGKVKTVVERDKDKTVAEKNTDKSVAERDKVKTVAGGDKDKTVAERDNESFKSDKVAKFKSDVKSQKTKEKSINQAISFETQRSLRDKKKKDSDDLTKATHFEKDQSEKKQNTTEGRRTRSKEPLGDEKDRRTRSRSGSKDKIKVMDERTTTKQKEEITVKNKKQDQEIITKNKKQNQDKIDTKHESVKPNDSKSRSVTRNSFRHCSVGSEEVKSKVQKRKSEAGEGHGAKTKIQKCKSEVEGANEPNSSQSSKDEAAAKVCKLDGTSNSPEKTDVPKCAHKLYIPGCDNCNERQLENTKKVKEPHRPAVRQIIHRGRVFEIQRGCVTETDIQDLTTKAGSSVKEASSSANDDQVKTRSRRFVERRKRAHSPEDGSETNAKDRARTVGMMDINKYISQTLREIKKEREGNSNNKWTVRQKKRTKDPFPYSFKKANSKQ